MKIVCAPDSFKGSVSAAEAAAAMARGARQSCPGAEILELPFADGGEGTLEAVLAVWGQQPLSAQTTDALGRTVTARYGISPDGRTALIEAAEANGLPQVADVALQPLRADTYGVGQLAAHVMAAGVEEILLCIGGSATTDGGTGILTALGARFLDHRGDQVPPGGGGLAQVASIDLSGLEERARDVRWRIAVDVENPLTGARGAAAVFGPQKGATEQDIATLDDGLAHLAEVLASATGEDANEYRAAAGFGAAGGIPLTLVGLLGAEVMPGSAMVADTVGLEEALAASDLVLTGEGRLDSQSLEGKVVDAVLSRAPASAQVVVIAGGVELNPQQCRDAGITAAFSISHGATDLGQLQARAGELIEHTAAHICALCTQPSP